MIKCYFISLVLSGYLLIPDLPAQGKLIISESYPQYWEYENKVTLLLGASNEDNLFQVPDLVEQLDNLQQAGGNYVRCTMSSRDSGNVWPFYFDEAKLLYDLNRWNDTYWNRFRNLLQLTSERGIIVQLEVWATFDYYRENWNEKNPFNPRLNQNYTSDRTKLPEDVNTHPIWCENPFFWSIPSQHNNIPVLTYQQKFVDELLSYTLNYDHVLYCMDNETSVTAEWGKFWALYIKQVATEHGKEVYCTEMWDPWDLGHLIHRETFDHPELYGFIEISQNNHQIKDQHWENGLRQIERLRNTQKLRPVHNVKIYGSDYGSHGGTAQDGIEKFIRNALMGCASMRFHRPPSGLGISDTTLLVIKNLRQVLESTSFFNGSPHQDLLSDRQPNEAFCRAIEGQEYIVYFPRSEGDIILELAEQEQEYQIQWIHFISKTQKTERKISAAERMQVRAPSGNHWVAIIKKEHE